MFSEALRLSIAGATSQNVQDSPDAALICINAARNELLASREESVFEDPKQLICEAERLLRKAVAMRWSAFKTQDMTAVECPSDEALATALDVLAEVLAARFEVEASLQDSRDDGSLLAEAITCLDDAIEIQARIQVESEQDIPSAETPAKDPKDSESLVRRRNELDKKLSLIRHSSAHAHWEPESEKGSADEGGISETGAPDQSGHSRRAIELSK